MTALRDGDVVTGPFDGEQRIRTIGEHVVVLGDDLTIHRSLTPSLTLVRRPPRLGDELRTVATASHTPRRIVRVDDCPGDPSTYFLDNGGRFTVEELARCAVHAVGVPIDAAPDLHATGQSLRLNGIALTDLPRFVFPNPFADLIAKVDAAIAAVALGPDVIVRAPDLDECAHACFGLHRSDLTALSRATASLMADLFALGVEAWPLWRTDQEVIAMVEAVADHRIGGRVSNGRLGRAYVRAWRSDHGGYRTQWMKRALDARAWRKT